MFHRYPEEMADGALKLKRAGREAAIQIASGGSAGFVEICIMHPLDVVKTRFQVQSNAADPERYKSIFDCFRRMTQSEGLFSIYKGTSNQPTADKRMLSK